MQVAAGEFTLASMLCVALVVVLAVPAAGQENADKPVLKPAVPRLDKVPDKKHFKVGVQHNRVLKKNKKREKRKKLKSATKKKRFLGKKRRGILGKKNLSGAAGRDQLSSSIDRSIGIIGVKFISYGRRPPVIHTVFPDTPAHKAGIRPNDLIVAVDGVPTMGLSKDECYDLIVGTPNTPVTLSLKRKDSFMVRKLVRMDFNDITNMEVRHAYMYPSQL